MELRPGVLELGGGPVVGRPRLRVVPGVEQCVAVTEEPLRRLRGGDVHERAGVQHGHHHQQARPDACHSVGMPRVAWGLGAAGAHRPVARRSQFGSPNGAQAAQGCQRTCHTGSTPNDPEHPTRTEGCAGEWSRSARWGLNRRPWRISLGFATKAKRIAGRALLCRVFGLATGTGGTGSFD